jgi:hypothetical protein
MNRTTTLTLLIVWALAAPLAALAQGDASAANDAASDQAFEQASRAERQRIAGERAAAHARYDQDRRACWQRFAVNACLDQARERRRAVLDALRQDELALNAQERQRRTTARLDELALKQAESTERDGGNRTADVPASPASGRR